MRIDSEVGRLEAVLLHRPGRELEELTPEFLEEMLFEDIPWLKKTQEEHDAFAAALRARGSRVYYYTELMQEILRDEQVRSSIIDELVESSRVGSTGLRQEIREYLEGRSAEELVEVLTAGLPKDRIDDAGGRDRLSRYIREASPFYIRPLTNLYFTRDPGAVIGEGLAVSAMKTPARMREALILRYLHEHHPLFSREAGGRMPLWYRPEDLDSIEGGDILVLSPQTIAVGCSARTGADGIQRLAERLFAESERLREVLVLQIPFIRAFMHLDTVLTMVDRDTFTIYPGIKERIELFRLSPGGDGSVRVSALDDLEGSLARSLGVSSVRFIESGGGDAVTAAREQWNDSTNTLALAPGVVAAYDRNTASNDALREAGIEVVEIAGSELVRGRGGPRCMSMPLRRGAV